MQTLLSWLTHFSKAASPNEVAWKGQISNCPEAELRGARQSKHPLHRSQEELPLTALVQPGFAAAVGSTPRPAEAE